MGDSMVEAGPANVKATRCAGSSKSQAPNLKTQNSELRWEREPRAAPCTGRRLRVGFWDLAFVCELEVGIWDFEPGPTRGFTPAVFACHQLRSDLVMPR